MDFRLCFGIAFCLIYYFKLRDKTACFPKASGWLCLDVGSRVQSHIFLFFLENNNFA